MDLRMRLGPFLWRLQHQSHGREQNSPYRFQFPRGLCCGFIYPCLIVASNNSRSTPNARRFTDDGWGPLG
jgi:hypothetical protein